MDGNTSAFVTAAIGLLGVLVGSAITTAKDYILAVRRERLEEQKNHKVRTMEIKRDARLIRLDLSVAHAAAKVCMQERQWWSAIIHPTIDGWKKYKGEIAHELNDESWRKLTVAFSYAETLINLYGHPNRPNKFSDSDIAGLAETLECIEQGIAALQPYTRDSFVLHNGEQALTS